MAIDSIVPFSTVGRLAIVYGSSVPRQLRDLPWRRFRAHGRTVRPASAADARSASSISSDSGEPPARMRKSAEAIDGAVTFRILSGPAVVSPFDSTVRGSAGIRRLSLVNKHCRTGWSTARRHFEIDARWYGRNSRTPRTASGAATERSSRRDRIGVAAHSRSAPVEPQRPVVLITYYVLRSADRTRALRASATTSCRRALIVRLVARLQIS
jgi:hypothetical protein